MKIIIFEVDPVCTVAQLKQEIMKEEGIALKYQNFTFNGQPLTDQQILGELGVEQSIDFSLKIDTPQLTADAFAKLKTYVTKGKDTSIPQGDVTPHFIQWLKTAFDNAKNKEGRIKNLMESYQYSASREAQEIINLKSSLVAQIYKTSDTIDPIEAAKFIDQIIAYFQKVENLLNTALQEKTREREEDFYKESRALAQELATLLAEEQKLYKVHDESCPPQPKIIELKLDLVAVDYGKNCQLRDNYISVKKTQIAQARERIKQKCEDMANQQARAFSMMKNASENSLKMAEKYIRCLPDNLSDLKKKYQTELEERRKKLNTLDEADTSNFHKETNQWLVKIAKHFSSHDVWVAIESINTLIDKIDAEKFTQKLSIEQQKRVEFLLNCIRQELGFEQGEFGKVRVRSSVTAAHDNVPNNVDIIDWAQEIAAILNPILAKAEAEAKEKKQKDLQDKAKKIVDSLLAKVEEVKKTIALSPEGQSYRDNKKRYNDQLNDIHKNITDCSSQTLTPDDLNKLLEKYVKQLDSLKTSVLNNFKYMLVYDTHGLAKIAEMNTLVERFNNEKISVGENEKKLIRAKIDRIRENLKLGFYFSAALSDNFYKIDLIGVDRNNIDKIEKETVIDAYKMTLEVIADLNKIIKALEDKRKAELAAQANLRATLKEIQTLAKFIYNADYHKLFRCNEIVDKLRRYLGVGLAAAFDTLDIACAVPVNDNVIFDLKDSIEYCEKYAIKYCKHLKKIKAEVEQDLITKKQNYLKEVIGKYNNQINHLNQLVAEIRTLAGVSPEFNVDKKYFENIDESKYKNNSDIKEAYEAKIEHIHHICSRISYSLADGGYKKIQNLMEIDEAKNIPPRNIKTPEEFDSFYEQTAVDIQQHQRRMLEKLEIEEKKYISYTEKLSAAEKDFKEAGFSEYENPLLKKMIADHALIRANMLLLNSSFFQIRQLYGTTKLNFLFNADYKTTPKEYADLKNFVANLKEIQSTEIEKEIASIQEKKAEAIWRKSCDQKPLRDKLKEINDVIKFIIDNEKADWLPDYGIRAAMLRQFLKIKNPSGFVVSINKNVSIAFNDQSIFDLEHNELQQCKTMADAYYDELMRVKINVERQAQTNKLTYLQEAKQKYTSSLTDLNNLVAAIKKLAGVSSEFNVEAALLEPIDESKYKSNSEIKDAYINKASEITEYFNDLNNRAGPVSFFQYMMEVDEANNIPPRTITTIKEFNDFYANMARSIASVQALMMNKLDAQEKSYSLGIERLKEAANDYKNAGFSAYTNPLLAQLMANYALLKTHKDKLSECDFTYQPNPIQITFKSSTVQITPEKYADLKNFVMNLREIKPADIDQEITAIKQQKANAIQQKLTDQKPLRDKLKEINELVEFINENDPRYFDDLKELPNKVRTALGLKTVSPLLSNWSTLMSIEFNNNTIFNINQKEYPSILNSVDNYLQYLKVCKIAFVDNKEKYLKKTIEKHKEALETLQKLIAVIKTYPGVAQEFNVGAQYLAQINESQYKCDYKKIKMAYEEKTDQIDKLLKDLSESKDKYTKLYDLHPEISATNITDIESLKKVINEKNLILHNQKLHLKKQLDKLSSNYQSANTQLLEALKGLSEPSDVFKTQEDINKIKEKIISLLDIFTKATTNKEMSRSGNRTSTFVVESTPEQWTISPEAYADLQKFVKEPPLISLQELAEQIDKVKKIKAEAIEKKSREELTAELEKLKLNYNRLRNEYNQEVKTINDLVKSKSKIDLALKEEPEANLNSELNDKAKILFYQPVISTLEKQLTQLKDQKNKYITAESDFTAAKNDFKSSCESAKIAGLDLINLQSSLLSEIGEKFKKVEGLDGKINILTHEALELKSAKSEIEELKNRYTELSIEEKSVFKISADKPMILAGKEIKSIPELKQLILDKSNRIIAEKLRLAAEEKAKLEAQEKARLDAEEKRKREESEREKSAREEKELQKAREEYETAKTKLTEAVVTVKTDRTKSSETLAHFKGDKKIFEDAAALYAKAKTHTEKCDALIQSKNILKELSAEILDQAMKFKHLELAQESFQSEKVTLDKTVIQEKSTTEEGFKLSHLKDSVNAKCRNLIAERENYLTLFNPQHVAYTTAKDILAKQQTLLSQLKSEVVHQQIELKPQEELNKIMGEVEAVLDNIQKYHRQLNLLNPQHPENWNVENLDQIINLKKSIQNQIKSIEAIQKAAADVANDVNLYAEKYRELEAKFKAEQEKKAKEDEEKQRVEAEKKRQLDKINKEIETVKNRVQQLKNNYENFTGKQYADTAEDKEARDKKAEKIKDEISAKDYLQDLKAQETNIVTAKKEAVIIKQKELEGLRKERLNKVKDQIKVLDNQVVVLNQKQTEIDELKTENANVVAKKQTLLEKKGKIATLKEQLLSQQNQLSAVYTTETVEKEYSAEPKKRTFDVVLGVVPTIDVDAVENEIKSETDNADAAIKKYQENKKEFLKDAGEVLGIKNEKNIQSDKLKKTKKNKKTTELNPEAKRKVEIKKARKLLRKAIPENFTNDEKANLIHLRAELGIVPSDAKVVVKTRLQDSMERLANRPVPPTKAVIENQLLDYRKIYKQAKDRIKQSEKMEDWRKDILSQMHNIELKYGKASQQEPVYHKYKKEVSVFEKLVSPKIMVTFFVWLFSKQDWDWVQNNLDYKEKLEHRRKELDKTAKDLKGKVKVLAKYFELRQDVFDDHINRMDASGKTVTQKLEDVLNQFDQKHLSFDVAIKKMTAIKEEAIQHKKHSQRETLPEKTQSKTVQAVVVVNTEIKKPQPSVQPRIQNHAASSRNLLVLESVVKSCQQLRQSLTEKYARPASYDVKELEQVSQSLNQLDKEINSVKKGLEAYAKKFPQDQNPKGEILLLKYEDYFSRAPELNNNTENLIILAPKSHTDYAVVITKGANMHMTYSQQKGLNSLSHWVEKFKQSIDEIETQIDNSKRLELGR